MEKAKFICLSYEGSDTIECQGSHDKISKYLAKGYYIVQKRNGYYVLAKSPRVNVTIQKEDGSIKTINMKKEITDYYNKSKISKGLANEFANDCQKGKVKFYIENGIICFS